MFWVELFVFLGWLLVMSSNEGYSTNPGDEFKLEWLWLFISMWFIL